MEMIAGLVVVEQDLGSREPGRTKATTPAACHDVAAKSARRVFILSLRQVWGEGMSAWAWHHTEEAHGKTWSGLGWLHEEQWSWNGQ